MNKASNKFSLIIFTIFFVSCSSHVKENPEKSSSKKVDKITAFRKENSTEQVVISQALMKLAIRLDSGGYIFDTARYKKTYNFLYVSQANANHKTRFYPVSLKILKQGNYLFYEFPFNESIPFSHYQFYINDTTPQRQEWIRQWQIDIEKLNKVQKITGYYFRKKAPDISNGETTVIDGIAEEWTFPDEKSASEAAVNLGQKQEMVYVNRGAFICYRGKSMFIFHSRSSAFMYSIKPFFQWFLTENKAIKTNKH